MKLVVLFSGGFAREDEGGMMLYCDHSHGPGWTKLETLDYLSGTTKPEKWVIDVNDGGAKIVT